MTVRRLARACSPRFYATLHRTRFANALSFLMSLLVVYEMVRGASFVLRHQETFATLSIEECARETAAAFPAELQIQVRSGRFYFTMAAPIVLDLPRCVGDGLALFSAYLSHGAVYPEEVWTLVAPLIVLLERNEHLDRALDVVTAPRMRAALAAQGIDTSNGLLFDHDAVFLSVGRSEAYLLDIVPVASLVESMLLAARERSEDEKPNMARVSQRSVFNAVQSLRTRLKKDTWAQHAFFMPIGLATMACGFLISIVMSFDLLITSTIIYVLVRKGLVAASFRFWDVRSHFALGSRPVNEMHFLSRAEAQEQQLWLVEEYRTALAENQGADGIFAELSDTYFVALVVHTATPALFIDAVYPYMIANAIGLGAVVHMILSVLIVRYVALPAVLMDRYVLPRLEARRRQQVRREANARLHQEARQSLAQENEASSSRDIQHDWSRYRLAQERIEETLRSPSLSLRTKLTTVMATMEHVRKAILHDEVHILHSWSSLNGTLKPKGGPGFVYGLSPSSGAWILLCWYEHPCSERGIRALTTYPGLVQIADQEVPDSLLPKEEELAGLQDSLRRLQRELRTVHQQSFANYLGRAD
ncbi:Hypothetical Protein FCC1311_070852 [Hondaea fermentalgiana]|uniref:Uncharacterized protein n=1 Tax=Hondaea fermentalgiana TaxID=2315210 RepID=A0A2R5GJR4_9STRA|nr:Hypothetical Protein FCC1311_070852 [Hondaea fermentalgiana]|eukprot:GBG30865.1 Hypothetical Protein FCC1311_070852 [Hondaea fermentalgiana]